MDTIFQAVLSWQFILFALSIAALTFVVRSVVEYCLDNPKIPTGSVTKQSKLWTELLLPILPVVSGAVIGFFATAYPFPDGLTTSSGRVAFGLVAGLLSGLLYRVIKGTLISKISGTTPTNPEDPGASVRDTINNG